MATSPENVSMALFCDFENVALGVRDAKYEKFDIKPVLERLLLKGSIVVKKAYCDWDRYKGFKATMHEANFELIEIPHVRQSGKNSADIRLVVDALDLCYTKSHVNTFVIISGDSDFSPLVSKLRENAKQVIGVGVKQSTSDLLIANCDEFIFYDDLVREGQRAAKRDTQPQPSARRSPDEEKRRKDELESRRSKAIEIAVETFEALVSERGDSGKIWASMLKEAIKRRKPDFNEAYYGFRAFGNLLEEAQSRGLLDFGRDEKSGAYVYRSSATATAEAVQAPVILAASDESVAVAAGADVVADVPGVALESTANEPAAAPAADVLQVEVVAVETAMTEDTVKPSRRKRGVVKSEKPKGEEGERTSRRRGAKLAKVAPAASAENVPASSEPTIKLEPVPEVSEAVPERKTPARSRRPRKPATPKAEG